MVPQGLSRAWRGGEGGEMVGRRGWHKRESERCIQTVRGSGKCKKGKWRVGMWCEREEVILTKAKCKTDVEKVRSKRRRTDAWACPSLFRHPAQGVTTAPPHSFPLRLLNLRRFIGEGLWAQVNCLPRGPAVTPNYPSVPPPNHQHHHFPVTKCSVSGTGKIVRWLSVW